jgi:hypothetical protein
LLISFVCLFSRCRPRPTTGQSYLHESPRSGVLLKNVKNVPLVRQLPTAKNCCLLRPASGRFRLSLPRCFRLSAFLASSDQLMASGG